MEMELKQAEAAIEAVLFTMGESVEVSKLAAAIDHAERLTKSRGDRAIVEMRKHVSWYLSGMHGSAALRGRVNSITSLDELKELLNEYLDTVKEKELH